MAFRSYEELIKMASNNPKQAEEYVRAAQQSSRPVVSADNPGYDRQAALRRSIKKKMVLPQDETVKQRKDMSY